MRKYEKLICWLAFLRIMNIQSNSVKIMKEAFRIRNHLWVLVIISNHSRYGKINHELSRPFCSIKKQDKISDEFFWSFWSLKNLEKVLKNFSDRLQYLTFDWILWKNQKINNEFGIWKTKSNTYIMLIILKLSHSEFI